MIAMVFAAMVMLLKISRPFLGQLRTGDNGCLNMSF
jgi:hypothetical protein